MTNAAPPATSGISQRLAAAVVGAACCALLLSVTIAYSRPLPPPGSPSWEAEVRLARGDLEPLGAEGYSNAGIRSLIDAWVARNVPATRLSDVVSYELVSNSAFIAACVGMKPETGDVERPKLFGCLVLHADSLALHRELLMQGACDVLDATNKPARRPTIRSIAPVTPPPDDIGMLGDRAELRGEAYLEVDATGRVVGVPYRPETGAFDADTTSINSWLFLTFAAGSQFQPEPEVPTTIVGLEYHALRKGESVVVEVTESLGCNARTWRASWPTSPEWRVIEEP